MEGLIDQIFSLLGQLIVAGGGGALIAWAIFKHLGKNWIAHQFAKDLEAAKAEINLLTARRMKLHDKEYEVFPEIWARLIKAQDSLSVCIISYKQMPDFRRMSEEKLSDWLRNSDFSEDEKSFFLSESDKNLALDRIIDFRNMREAETRSGEFREYYQANKIFLRPEIKKKFDQIQALLRKAWAARSTDLNHRGNTGQKDFVVEAYNTLEKEIKPLMGEIESLLQNILFPSDGVKNERGQ